jgi:hypothetical protein
MEVMKSSNTTGSWEEALVVRFIDGSEQQYERVGVVANVSPNARPWTTAKSWFDSLETHEITLV